MRAPLRRPTLQLLPRDRDRLMKLANASTTQQAVARRARIVLLSREGLSNQEVADAFRVSKPTVIKWRFRYRIMGIEGLFDAERPGRPSRPDRAKLLQLVGHGLLKAERGNERFSARRFAS